MSISPRLLPLLFLVLLASPAGPLRASLALGPMLGPIDFREATVWLQTEAAAEVRIVYSQAGATGAEARFSPVIRTQPENGFTAVFRLGGVMPGERYRYQVEVDGTLQPGTYHFELPFFYHDRQPPPDFSFAVGGAHYAVEEPFEPPYQVLGGGYEIFDTIARAEPAFMLWLGNTAHLRVSDWGSRSGYWQRHQSARSLQQLAPLLASVPHYATWGAADYGSPGADGAYSFRGVAESAFRAFWPQPVTVPGLGGLATRFRYADVDFFLLDTRSHRADRPTGSAPTRILGEAQIDWLRRELVRSEATFKVVAAGAPILNPADSEENLSFASEEHTRLLQMLRDERIPGLVFLSGGKYYGELTRLVHANSYNLYDLTLGPLTAKPRRNEDELNFFRMPGTSTFERHFALIDVSGPEEARELTFRVLSLEGEQLWMRTVTASELQPPASD